jgi:hypothetical protein
MISLFWGMWRTAHTVDPTATFSLTLVKPCMQMMKASVTKRK